MLNEAGAIPNNCDVVVAPPALHVGSVLATLRKDVKVALQNSWSEPKAFCRGRPRARLAGSRAWNVQPPPRSPRSSAT
jgi:hypothetical protein